MLHSNAFLETVIVNVKPHFILSRRALAGLVAVLPLLAACGQRGPLYMPSRPPLATPVPATAPEPAAAKPAESNAPVSPTTSK
ncbi:lipoprotein [Janthinobacterium sp. 17J80-10]|uniref:LPS translocon maturation chaperone LptM n=1 Tax=Janthinobacterium sp. 17J80-10 TaxID=2497863 RepID=UPI0010054D8A|nr:lipoprotein [Janthinobacterium sp. 17J80-10]QAU35861.1 hypothetical protein EKL02_17785 [Janthinobacterium sp. 17J80-10]